MTSMSTTFGIYLAMSVNFGFARAETTTTPEWMSSEVLMIAGTAVLSYLVMVVGRKIYNSVAPQGGTPEVWARYEPQYVPRSENDAPPAMLKKQLLEVQERVEYNQLIGDAAENDDLETMYKVLTQMETLGVTPNKVTFEHFLRVLIRCDGINPLDAAAQAETLMTKLKNAGVEADMHTFSLMAKIYAVTGSKQVESKDLTASGFNSRRKAQLLQLRGKRTCS